MWLEMDVVDAEILRGNALGRLRELSKKRGVAPAVFEKWHFTWMVNGCHNDGSGPVDPLLPAVDAKSAISVDTAAALDAVMVRAGSEGLAENKAALFRKEAVKEATKLRKAVAKITAGPMQPAVEGLAIVMAPLQLPTHVQIQLSRGETALKLNKTHYDKLERRFKLANAIAAGAPSADATLAVTELNAAETAEFHAKLFCVLSRYKAICGGGFQCALPPRVWQTLRAELGLELEGFASPLNCTLDRYCSAFVDTDAAFGSSGSIFKLLPTLSSGAISLNPPYVTDYYVRMTALLQARLAESDKAGLALSFTVVVGANEEVRQQAWFGELGASAFCRHRMIIKIHEHGFIDGRQHIKKDALDKPVCVCDTGVFFLQTAAAGKATPLTPERMAKIKAAWLATRPHPEDRPPKRSGAADGDGQRGPKKHKRQKGGSNRPKG